MREKLMLLLQRVQDGGYIQGLHVTHLAHVSNETVADYLIDNGVTIPVLCGECRHFHHDDDKLAQHCRLFGAMMNEDDFCSCGERRTDETKTD